MVLWYAASVVTAIAVGWVAATIHATGHAPVILTSIGVGAALGAILGAIAASQRLAGRRKLIIGAIILSLIAVLAEHAWLYHDFRRQWHKARLESHEVAMFRPAEPWSPQEYFERERTPARLALWCADAVLIVAAAVGATLIITSRTHLNSASRPTPTSTDFRPPTPNP